MKLNKIELDAITNKLHTELKEAAASAQKELNEVADKQNLSAAKLMLRQINSFKPELKNYLDSSRANSPDLNTILRSMRPKQTKVKGIGHYAGTEIRQALIIAQIDSPDINSMVEAVKKQFMS